MAYRKYKRRSRKRNYKKKTKGIGDLTLRETAVGAWKAVKAVQRLINVEIKHHDVILFNANISDTAFVNNLTMVPQGDSETQRDGISIKPLNLSYRYFITKASPVTYNQVRMIIFRGKLENGVAYTASDILASQIGPGAIISPRNYDERFRTQILYDRVHNLNNNTVQAQQLVTGYIRLTGHINYDKTDATGATIEGGGLYVMLVSDNATVGNQPSANFHYRLTYTDN